MRDDSPSEDSDCSVDSSCCIGPCTFVAKPRKEKNAVPSSSIRWFTPHIQARLDALGITSLFPIQASSIPYILATVESGIQADVCISSPTGSGKTLSYALPIVDALMRTVSTTDTTIRCLVMVPSRDLAKQVARVFEGLILGSALRLAVLVGAAVDPRTEALDLVTPTTNNVDDLGWDSCVIGETTAQYSSKVDIIVGTPGRVIDHLEHTAGFKLDNLEFLVVDEADLLLSASYQDWCFKVLRSVRRGSVLGQSITTASSIFGLPSVGLSYTGRHCIKVLCSATLPTTLAKLEDMQLVSPQYIRLTDGVPSHGARPTSGSLDASGPLRKFALPAGLKEFVVKCTMEDRLFRLVVLLLRIAKASRSGRVIRPDLLAGLCQFATGGQSIECPDDDDDDDSTMKIRRVDDVDAVNALATHAVMDAMTNCQGSTLIFAQDVDSAHRVARFLEVFGFNVAEYSGHIPQHLRSIIIDSLRADVPLRNTSGQDDEGPSGASSHIGVVVCSDVMARGMDVDGVQHVINYDMPSNVHTYLHRVGRTARAGRMGSCFTLTTSKLEEEALDALRAKAVCGSLTEWPHSQVCATLLIPGVAKRRAATCVPVVADVLAKEKRGGLPVAASVGSLPLEATSTTSKAEDAQAAGNRAKESLNRGRKVPNNRASEAS